MQIALAQTAPVVGAMRQNVDDLLRAAAQAKAAGAQLVLAPELATCGYPPRDLLNRPAFVTEALAALRRLRDETPVPLLVGSVVGVESVCEATHRIANGAVLLAQGQVLACHRKMLLPNYDIFDDPRYFTPGEVATVVPFGGELLGISVCEDIWSNDPAHPVPRYGCDPMAMQAHAGASLLCNLSASPYDRTKPARRLALLRQVTANFGLPILYVNQVGTHDSLIFDGGSLALGGDGQVQASLPAFVPAQGLVRLDGGSLQGPMHARAEAWEDDVTDALVMGLRDYVARTGHRRVVLGLSGGIDSALVAVLAVRALGAENVHGVAMPSRYSSASSRTDAAALAQNLGIACDLVSIEPMFAAYLAALAEPFAGRAADVTEENLQARIRGALLMAYSNKLGALLLTTGNKSEVAVGYTTLYGDMCGALGPISDLYKTEVYALAHALNRRMPGAPIPAATLAKPPSAELRLNQTDADSLPPYAELDALLRDHVEAGLDGDALLARGHAAATLAQVLPLVARSEHKRRQMAPGLRVSRRAFGEGWRQPLARQL